MIEPELLLKRIADGRQRIEKLAADCRDDERHAVTPEAKARSKGLADAYDYSLRILWTITRGVA